MIISKFANIVTRVVVVVYNESAKKKILDKFKIGQFSCKVIVKPNWYY